MVSKKRIEDARCAVLATPEYRLATALAELHHLEAAREKMVKNGEWDTMPVLFREQTDGALDFFRQVRDEAVKAIEKR